ncbi:MAG TPA: ATP synthase F0 subunit B [Candidatus Sulfotelmatobacter sp.]|nr:ATP synthase F0 subunit B [Candidatus Sulfotelmatobacter sp.]
MSLDTLALVSQMAGAVIFVLVAIWGFNKWIKPALSSYQAAKNDELAEAEKHREEMKRAVAEARAEIERADEDAREIRSRVESVAQRERAHALEQAKAEAERILRNADHELERARMQARDRLRVEFIEKALVKASAQAGSRIDTATDNRLVEATVSDLAARKAG